MWYRQFYLAHVMRRFNQLSNPPFSRWETFDPPRESMFHYLPMYENDFGIDANHPYFKNWKGFNWVYHVADLYQPSHLTIKKPFIKRAAILGYHKRFKQIKWLRDPKWVDQKGAQVNNNIVIDYCLANKGYRYKPSLMTKFYQWKDMYETVWKSIAVLASKSNRQHFIKLEMPEEIPDRLLLNRVQKDLKVMHLQKLTTWQHLFIYDLWMWISGEFRHKSPISHVKIDGLKRINIILSESDQFTVINLHDLHQWSSGVVETSEEDEDEENEFNKSKGETAQRRFLVGLNKLRSLRVYPVTKEITEKTQADKSDKTIEETILDQEKVQKGATSTVTEELELDVTDDGEIIEVKNGIIDVVVPKEDPRPATPIESTDTVNETPVPKVADIVPEKEIKSTKSEPEESLFQSTDEVNHTDASLEDQITDKLAAKSIEKALTLRNSGFYTQKDVDRIIKASQSFKTLANPFNPELTLEDVILKREAKTEVDREIKATEIPDSPWIFDKSMLKTKASTFDKTYIKENLKEDTVAMVMNLQETGLNITNYQVEEEKNALSEYETHRIQFTPVGGAVTTVSLKMPKIQEDGSFLADGVRYYLRKQRADIVIRKVSPIKSSLTTYYGKLNITRIQDMKYSIGNYIEKFVNSNYIDQTITHLHYGNKEIKTNASRFYVELARRYSGFELNNIHFNFHSDETMQQGEETLQYIGLQGKDRLYINPQAICYTEDHRRLGYLWELMEMPYGDVPVEFTEVKLLGERIPVGFILGRYKGMTRLIKDYKLKYLRTHTKEEGRYQRNNDEFTLKFADGIMVFDKRDPMTCLLIGGFQKYAKSLTQYSIADFNQKDIYGTILLDTLGHPRIERELDILLDLFIDPISEASLNALNEPTNVPDLFHRATELLINDMSPSEINMEDMVIKGYERVPGAMYRQLVKAVKQSYGRQLPSSKRKIVIHPNAVWDDIMTDPAKDIQDDINPIQALKEVENVTFEGTGGRSVRTMKEKHRGYDDTDLGIISEATVDNGKVGITTFLSAAPNLETVYGKAKIKTAEDLRDNKISLQSTSKALAPFSDAEDLKRQGFISVQSAHKIPMKGAIVYPVRTGYEHAMAHRLDNRYSYVAKGDGVIRFNQSPTVKVEYSDDTLGMETITIGDRFANSKGTTFHHHIVCDLPEGIIVKKGDVLVYNRDFFERDIFEPTQVIMKLATIAKVALVENNDTLEDSSLITANLSKRMTTTAVHQKTIIIEGQSRVSQMVSVGDMIEEDSILCTILDGSITDSYTLDDDANETLKRLSANSPRMGEHGKVVKIDVFYRMDPEEASRDVAEIIRQGDLARRKVARQRNERVTTGLIESDITIGGKKLFPGNIAVTFYVEHDTGMAGGDKAVIANQMKTVVAATISGINRTEHGEDIDAFFGYASISNRIVDSPILIGMTTTLLKHISKRALQAYDTGTLLPD